MVENLGVRERTGTRSGGVGRGGMKGGGAGNSQPVRQNECGRRLRDLSEDEMIKAKTGGGRRGLGGGRRKSTGTIGSRCDGPYMSLLLPAAAAAAAIVTAAGAATAASSRGRCCDGGFNFCVRAAATHRLYRRDKLTGDPRPVRRDGLLGQ